MLGPNLPLSDQLRILEQKASDIFTSDVSLSTYQRISVLERYIQDIDAQADIVPFANHPDLKAVFEVASSLPITLQQTRFNLVNLQPRLLADALALAESLWDQLHPLHDTSFDNIAAPSPPPPSPLEAVASSISRFAVGIILNDELINFLIKMWRDDVDPSIKLVDSWWSSSYILERGQPRADGPVRLEKVIKKGKKNSVFGFEVRSSFWSQLAFLACYIRRSTIHDRGRVCSCHSIRTRVIGWYWPQILGQTRLRFWKVWRMTRHLRRRYARYLFLLLSFTCLA